MATLLNMEFVIIANPLTGSQRYTSGRSAARHFRRERADITEDWQLYFFDGPQLVQRRVDELTDRAIAAYRGGVVSWAGSSAQDQGRTVPVRRPGEVRS